MLETKLQKSTCYIVAANKADKGFEDGCGVLCGDYILTAGHVVENATSITVVFDNQIYNLLREEHLIFLDVSCRFDKERGHDLAVLKSPIYKNDVILADITPLIGQKFISISYKHVVKSDTSNIFGVSMESYDCIINEGHITEVEANFFGCKMIQPLEQGRSGSPCFIGNKIIGLLHGGVGDISKTCCYESAQSIYMLIKSKGLSL